eukprot:gb/GFBE01060232.1/.p1 GENE.gb/GFBE01060232.1/~~gb/GFBE01060232.1/.p1  ORF type:complete len:246 (+),score=46.25 gb/GFBE01060232.1/:1-738(+)
MLELMLRAKASSRCKLCCLSRGAACVPPPPEAQSGQRPTTSFSERVIPPPPSRPPPRHSDKSESPSLSSASQGGHDKYYLYPACGPGGLQGQPSWFNARCAELNSYAAAGDVAKAATIFSDIWRHAAPSKHTMLCNTLLKAYANAGEFGGAAAWYEECRKQGVRVNAKTFGKLIESAAKAGNLAEAEHWLAAMALTPGLAAARDRVSFNAVIDACAKAGNPAAALSWLEKMLKASVAPDEISFNS